MLPCLLAAPTLVRIGGVPYLARPLTLGGFALLLRNGGDALKMDGDAGDLPAFSDERFGAWLEGEGAGLFAWEVLKRDQGVTLAECHRLAGVPGAMDAIRAAALRRATPAVPPPGSGTDVAHLDWGAVVHRYYIEANVLPDAVASLTLDQAYLIATHGKGFVVPDEGRAVLDDMQRQWEEMYGEKGPAPPSPPDPGPVPEGVSPEVAADVAAMGLRFAGGTDELR